jgi:hypothetical protein
MQPSLFKVLLLILTAVQLVAPQTKPAIYWKGDLLVANASASAAVRTRGFTHALSASVAGASALTRAGLGGVLLLSDTGNESLRSTSPYLNASAYTTRLAALQQLMESTPLVGIAEDREDHPFPYVTYAATGEATVSNYTDLMQRLGLAQPASPTWPTFDDWPTPNAHPLGATMAQIQYNYPQLVVASPPPSTTPATATPIPTPTTTIGMPGDTTGLAIPFRTPPGDNSSSSSSSSSGGAVAATRVTRIELPVWGAAPSTWGGLGGAGGHPPSEPSAPSYPSEPLSYYVCGSTSTGAPDTNRILQCDGCQVRVRVCVRACLSPPLPLSVSPHLSPPPPPPSIANKLPLPGEPPNTHTHTC